MSWFDLNRKVQSGRIFTDSRSVYPGNITYMCGFPSFCTHRATFICEKTPLISCLECNRSHMFVLGAMYVLMGIFIVLGNGMVLTNVFFQRKGFRDTYSIIRGSLAVADIISGIQIFLVMVNNLIKTAKFTARELDSYQLSTEGSTEALVGGVFYLLGFTSSLYHLVYLSSQMVYAISMPIRYRLRTNQSTYISLGIVWVLAIIASTFPLWFPGKTTFSYYATIFLYFPSFVTNSKKLYKTAITTLIFLLVYPYLMMTLLTAGAGAMIYCYYKNTMNGSPSRRSQLQRIVCKKELRALKIVACMEVGFTITLLPLSVGTSMYYSGHLNCSNFSTTYLICFVLSISNSFVNILIYSVFDKNFRSSISALFGRCVVRRCKNPSRDSALYVSSSKQSSDSFGQATGSSNLISKVLFEKKSRRVFSIS